MTQQAPELPNKPNHPLLCLPCLTAAHFEKGPSFSFMSGLQDQRMQEGGGALAKRRVQLRPQDQPPKAVHPPFK